MTKKEFVFKANKKYDYRFDYSKVDYIDWNVKVCIICPTHGEFWQTPYTHLKSKHGCPSCALEIRKEKKRSTRESFIEKAIATHGDRYIYDRVVYVDSYTKVSIGCEKHGYFYQTPVNHLSGSGCPECGIERIKKHNTYTQKEVIEKFRQVHGDKYIYDKTEYKGSFIKVIIGCREHGDFLQTPVSHLAGQGCQKCALITIGMSGRITREEFITRANIVHNNKYDYSLVPESTLSTDKIPIICPKHGLYYQNKQNHLNGSGCPHCSLSKGEEEIERFLQEHNICHERQYEIYYQTLFCQQSKIKVDFYISSQNTIIEYNGRQHYKPIEAWGGQESLKKQQWRDDALRQYCMENKIKLVEIPYTEFDNIKEILTKELNINE